MKTARAQLWGTVVIWVSIIYGSVYVARPICDFLMKKNSLTILVNSILLFSLAGLGIIIIQKIRIRKPSSYMLLGLVCLSYLFGFKILTIPAEKIHFFEYGVLAFLIFRAVSFDWPPLKAYAAAVFLTTLLGWGDEGLQAITPGRYYQFQDVMLNSVSGGLGLLLTFVAQREQKQGCGF